MRAALALSLLLVFAPVLAAQDVPQVSGPAPAPEVTAAPAPAAAPLPEPAPVNTEPARAEDRQISQNTVQVEGDPFARGSFWWMVGVIVVAGLILFVLLD